MAEAPAAAGGRGRLTVGLAWALVLVALWLWGKGNDPGAGAAPTTGDVAAVGRPGAHALPTRQGPTPHGPTTSHGPAPNAPTPHGPTTSHSPAPGAAPRALDIAGAGVHHAPVVARGLDAAGAVEPPPYRRPGDVGWYRAGPPPGAAGVAVLVGHVDTESGPAVFHDLSALRPGAAVRVTRTDGTVAEFTVEEVAVVPRARFDARRVYGQGRPGRAELRLLTCGGTFDRATRTYTANVVVFAYLTGVRGGVRG
ncbi:class F sortase [Streptomyces sp. HSW2009]|uniref:class F sortase n=1 Tax=Streptomyces sp. HSW2009 TaxID=3142890 RepID=UPI0032EE625D